MVDELFSSKTSIKLKRHEQNIQKFIHHPDWEGETEVDLRHQHHDDVDLNHSNDQ